MSHKEATCFYTHGVRSAQTARRLISLNCPTQRALSQTVEILGETRDIFGNEDVVYVRSTLSPLRYLSVEQTADGCKCSCEEIVCSHARRALRYLKAQGLA